MTKFMLLICFLLVSDSALAQFENNPRWFGDLAIEILKGRNQADAVQKGECEWYDGKPNPDSKPGLNCQTNVGGIDVYTIGSEDPQETRIVHLIAERAVLKEAFRVVLIMTIAMFDGDFLDSKSIQKMDAFLNNISKQPPRGGPPLLMQGVKATYEGFAFYHSFISKEAVSVKIQPRR